MNATLEDQIRLIADAAFDQTLPVRVDRFASDPGRPRIDRRWVAVAAAALTGLLVGALAWVGKSEEQIVPVDTRVPAPTSSSTATTDDASRDVSEVEGLSTQFSARSMLQEIPLRAEGSSLTLRVSGVDFALISELTGVDRTGKIDTSGPPSDWFDALFLQDAFTLPFMGRLSVLIGDPAVGDELRFGLLDIDRFVSMSPFGLLDVNEGYGGEVNTAVLRSDMSELSAMAGDDSIIDIGTGADGDADLDQRTDLRPTGSPLRLGVDAQRSMVSVASSTSTVESWLTNSDPTLADVDDLLAGATALDLDDELYTAELAIFDRDASDPADPLYDEGTTPDDIVIREEFTTLGWGASGIGDTQRTTIVYVFADEIAAGLSVEPVTTLYSPEEVIEGRPDTTVADLFRLDAVEAVGRTVVVSGQMEPGGANDFSSLLWGARSVHR